MKKTILFTIILHLTFNIFAQPTKIEPELLKNSWEAQWISAPDIQLHEYNILHFRKKIELQTVPDEFIIHISADNRYKLYINGKNIAKGPARGNLANWYFETIDIAPYLQNGKNTIAALVWNHGKYKPLAQVSNQTGLVIQGNTKAESVLNTNKSWKCAVSKAYKPIPVKKDWVKGYYVAGPGDNFDGNNYLWNWEQNEFDDSQWLNAYAISRATPQNYMWTAPWCLTPRTIPLLENTIERSQQIARVEGIKKINAKFLTGEKAVKIPAKSNVSILIDHKRLTVGYPNLLISQGKNAKIKITYAEALYDENNQKGNRNKIEGKKISGYYDIFTSDGGKNRKFEPVWLRTFRYIQLDIETFDEELILNDFYHIFWTYPFTQKAKFESNNPDLLPIWDVSWRTARLCAGETYFDCPYYEQLQYVGDTRIQALISLFVTGDDRLMKQAIDQIDYSRDATGLTKSRYPCEYNAQQVIPSFSLYWIVMIHDFFRYRNDMEFVKKYLPNILTTLNWFDIRMNENGLLGPVEHWNFVDWSSHYNRGMPHGTKKGNSSITTLHYLFAIQKTIEMLEYFDMNCEAEKWKEKASQIQKSIKNTCLAVENGLIANTPDKKHFSQHANIMAVLTDVYTTNEQKSIVKKLLTDSSLIEASIYYQFYLFRAMKKTGHGNEYLNNLQDWKTMLDLGLTTFVEGLNKQRSDCHAWSASPLFDFLNIIAGIESAAPGFEKIEIAPNPGNLENIKITFPHQKGIINYSLIKKENRIFVEIILPTGLTGNFLWKNEKMKLKEGKNTFEIERM